MSRRGGVVHKDNELLIPWKKSKTSWNDSSKDQMNKQQLTQRQKNFNRPGRIWFLKEVF